ncbi:protein kinase [Leptolyngbya sp. FACHB-16]|nr:protein kinase [Leptolyngbya sp. FACHB-8]MBD2157787.1 protein kinase [Leptolyngbya sp. FACHB-16]
MCVVGKSLQNGKYIIEQELGRGGFGVTYKAVNSALGQAVVVKTLNESLRQDPRFASSERQFQDEARRLARFAHPHIVRVNDFFVEDGLPYIVMDYIPGQTLDTLVLPNHPLPEAIALHYIRQVSAAVRVIHQNGLLHRDIKPQNLILQQGTQNVILIDFGIAREFTPGLTQTHTHLVSEGYAPIEQYLPQAKRSPATDIYGLSATLYTLLTAQVPVTATLRDRLPLASPRDVNPGISASVSAAVMRGMEIEPHHRPASVDEWLAFLPDIATVPHEMATVTPNRPMSQIATVAVAPVHRPIETEPAPVAVTPLAKPSGLRPWHIGLIGLAALVPFGLGFALLSAQKPSSSPTAPATTAPTPVITSPSASPTPATVRPSPVINEPRPSLPESSSRDESNTTLSKDLSPEDLEPTIESVEPSPPASTTPVEPAPPSAEPAAPPAEAGTGQGTEQQEGEEREPVEAQGGDNQSRAAERAGNEEGQAAQQEQEGSSQEERQEGEKVKE